mmetsp:Transcript_3113/g.4653  ORF Transcript_3113/g.4653 Transcript_3113/m.4653 type:complete len:223 (-) Transcript_3113:114-782(-)
MRLYSQYLQFSMLPEDEAATGDSSSQLPLSKLKNESVKLKKNTFMARLSAARIPVVTRSKYFCMSGNADNFTSASELEQTADPRLSIDLESIPVCEFKDRQLRDMPLNAYVADFFRHGSLRQLVDENGLAAGEAWKLLKDWSRLLGNIAQAILELQVPDERYAADVEYYGYQILEKNNTTKAFTVLSTQFSELFNNWNSQQTNQRKKIGDIVQQQKIKENKV